MANRKNYTVLVPYPKGGGHWTSKGDKLELLEVEAQALRQAGRIKLTAEPEPEPEPETPAPAAKKVAARKPAAVKPAAVPEAEAPAPAATTTTTKD